MKTAKTTAAEAYAARRNEVARLIDMLEQELKVLDGRRANARGWEYVGDLGHISEELVNLVAFASNTEPDSVRDSLGIRPD